MKKAAERGECTASVYLLWLPRATPGKSKGASPGKYAVGADSGAGGGMDRNAARRISKSAGKVHAGFGRTAALSYRASTVYQIY